MAHRHSQPARLRVPIEHRVRETLCALEYPLPGKEIPKSRVRKLHPWLRDFVGKTSKEAAEMIASRWNCLSDRMLIRIRDFFLGFRPKSIIIAKSEAVFMLSRPSWDKTFDKHWFIAPPPDSRQLRNGLRRFGFEESSLISDFMSAFGGLREEIPDVSGYFPAIYEWIRFDKYLRATWDLCIDPKLALWSSAVVFYISLNGDVVLLRPDQTVGWWDHEVNAVKPLRKSFRGFLQYYGKCIQSDYPFSSWAPPTHKERLRANRISRKLENEGMRLVRSMK